MKKATIIFGSTTGNTEIVADQIAENMPGYTVEVVYVTDAKDDAAVQAADLVVYGCSTMGLGELQEDFIPYYENRMTPALLKGKNVAVFGLGDKENYEDYFCWAADILAKKVQACGANLVCDPLKVDGEPDDNRAAVAAWAQAL
ncbi:MAG TPA: flavodoxin domain-containing protein [Candidatus Evtepia faecavium]|nr:flavodoxin domain-containing protein [Candidatus Evtepia faecavium]